MRFFNFAYERIKIDWWEITHLGIVGYLSFIWDWVLYLLTVKKHKPNFFAYQETGQDLEFDFSKDTDDPKFEVKE